MSEANQIQPKTLFSVQKFISAYYFEFLSNESYTETRTRSYNFYTLYFVARGDRHLRINDVCYHLFDGDLAIVSPETPHQVLHSDHFTSNDFGIYTFTCNSPKIKKLANKIYSLTNKERSLILNAIFSIADKLAPVKCMPDLHGFTLKENTSIYILSLSVQYIELLLTTLFLDRYGFMSCGSLLNVGDMDSKSTEDIDITSRIKTFLMENLDKQIQLKDITAHMCMSLSCIEKIFKKNTGHSITEYLHILRINRIKTLILYSNLNLKEIAKRTAFNSMQYFSYFFKKHTGLSPSEYAKQRITDIPHAGRTLKLARPQNLLDAKQKQK